MTLRKSILPLLGAALIFAWTTEAHAETQAEWLKRAQVGPKAPAKQDWKAIEAAARKEGKVVIYSVSSRIFKLVKKFKKKYGIDIVGHDLTSAVQMEKFRREYKAGLHQTDVMYNNETPLLLNEFLTRKMVWNFVPESFAGELAKNEKDPFLVQRWSSRVIVYNSAKHPNGAPIDNLWDLTRKEWRGKFLASNPLSGSVGSYFFQTILQHPKEMAAAYEKEFGTPIKYSKAVKKAAKKNPLIGKPNASMEWLHRFLKNKPVFLESTSKIYKGVASVKQANPPMGLTTFSRLRKNKKGVHEAQAAYNVTPVFGTAYPTVMVIADRAPHPNAAKLLIRYMMEEGHKPWNVLGDYAARSSVEKKQVKKFKIPPFEKVKLWSIDPNRIYESKYSFVGLYLALKK
jgi:iron(III) transport system substrate-binding protein